MTKDITLPVTWEQIGVPDAHRAFYGIFDGDGHRITIEPGGRALFAFVGECTIKNLNIYGSDILGCGLVDNANTDYGEDGSYWTGCPEGPTLDKIRLLSGSRTHSSGLLVGSGSGANTMHISNCVIEKDVTVGDQGQSYIGSIVGASFNGFMDNCYSFANVIGTDTIGGLVAKKGESMGACLISNSAFIGTIDASGNRVGGILGSGYSDASAPNTPPASVVNCYVIGDISGANGVGGIFGGEFGLKVAWNPGTISNNLFYGKISSNGEDVGGIIGYYGGIDSWITITNNYYCESTGKVLPTIGKIGRIDVNTHEYSMTTEQEAAFQTGIANCDKTTAEMSDGTVLHKLNSGAYNNWIQDDLYPIIDSSKIVPQTLTVGGDYKTTYYVGDALDMTGATFTVSYSNGAKDEIAGDSTDITYSGFDSSKRGPQTVTATYGPVWTEFDVTVLLKDTGTSSDNITVYFKLLGDDKHDSDIDGKLHTLEHGGLQTWVPNRAYTVDHNATVWDLLQEVLPQYSIICGNPSGNYIEDMTYNGVTIGEFSNGPNSGWMYTLNGEHPLFGVQEQFLSDGDEIVWHYTDDWTQESGAEFLAQPDPNFSGSTKKDEKKAEKKDEGDSMAITPEDIKAAADADKGLDIVTENGTVKLSADTVKELAKGGAEVSVAVTDNGDGTRTISITAGDKPVTADVKIELASDDGKMLVIVGADGRETPVILSATDGGKLFAVVPAGAKVKAVDAQGLSFGDVKASDWFAGAVKFVTSRGIFNGTDVGFEPTAPMNRAMLVTVLQRIAGEQAKGENTFGDVKADAWYADAVIWASENGIVNGTDKGFEPDKPVTREQIATMLYRFMQHLGVDVSASKTLDGFGDGASTSPWAREAMEWAAGVGLFQGDETGKLNPGSQATRAEVATLVERLIGLMVK